MANKKVILKDNLGNALYPQTDIDVLLNSDGTKYNAPKPDEKTNENQKVVIDSNGKLWTKETLVDSELNPSSVNPVQNKIISNEINSIKESLINLSTERVIYREFNYNGPNQILKIGKDNENSTPFNNNTEITEIEIKISSVSSGFNYNKSFDGNLIYSKNINDENITEIIPYNEFLFETATPENLIYKLQYNINDPLGMFIYFDYSSFKDISGYLKLKYYEKQ